ncbi:hypothetical protein [Yeosuana sp. AK3]
MKTVLKTSNNSNSGRLNVYYRLNELNKLTGLSSRMLKYKMLKVKNKYANAPNLLTKDGKSWQIHYSILNEFMPVNKLKSNTISIDNWTSFVTWNPFDNYDVDYHYQLIKEIKAEVPETKIRYTIELDKRGNNHVHFICDSPTFKTKKIVEKVLFKYFNWYEITYKVSDIVNKFNSINYLTKAPIKKGIL